MEKLLLDVGQAMEFLGVDAEGLANLISREGLPAFLLNGEVKLFADEVKDWAARLAEKETLAGVDKEDLIALIELSDGKAAERDDRKPSAHKAGQPIKEKPVEINIDAILEKCERTAPPPRMETGEEAGDEKQLYTVTEGAPDEMSVVLFEAFSIKYLIFETLVRLEPGVPPDSPAFKQLRPLLDDMQIRVADLDAVKRTLNKFPGRWVRLGEVPNPFRQRVNVRVSSDGLRAYVAACATDEAGSLSMMDVDEELAIQGINFGVDRESLRRAVENKMFGHLVLAAQGKAPVPGGDAKIEFLFDPEKTLSPGLLETGNVDFKNLKKITGAEAGDLLVRKTPPGDGEEGTDVRGNPVAARRGRDIRIRPGVNTFLSEDCTELHAEINGHVFVRGDVVHVENILVLDGDVDYSSGNIDFSGILIVNGVVRQGFDVRADGNISVNQGVEGARVESRKGDVTIRLGVHGQNKALIKAAGNIKAKFFNQAKVEAGGDIVVQQAITHSDVSARGSVLAQGPRGSIIGGAVRAGYTVIARFIGSGAHVKTSVTLEIINRETGTPARESLTRQKAKLEHELKKTLTSVKHLKTRTETGKPDPGLIQTLKVTARKAKELDKILKQLTDDLEKFSSEYGLSGCRFIRAESAIYPQVILNIENNKLKINETLRNCTFCCDAEKGNLVVCKELTR